MSAKYGFKISRKGYDPAEVDAYIDEQLARMTEMQEQNSMLLRKLAEAQDMIRHYSETEKHLRESIAQSKRGAADMLSDARSRSTALVDTAREECNKIVDELDAEIEARYKTLDDIKSTVVSFKNELFRLYSQHIETIEVLSETAENFTYEPDFTALSDAIDEFEEGAAEADREAEVPEFPEVPEEGFFADEEEELEEEEADLSQLDFGFEEADEEDSEGEEESDEASEDDEMFFDPAEAVAEEETEEEEYEEYEEELVDEGEADGEDSDEEDEDASEDSGDDDDMFFTSEDEHKDKEDLFNFLKDFVNGSEE